MLQDKLSYYLDRVEMAIVRQISLQSDAFFKAMESHEELHVSCYLMLLEPNIYILVILQHLTFALSNCF